MRYVIHAGALLSDVLLVVATIIVLKEFLNPIGLLVVALAWWAWRRTGGLSPWRPSWVRTYYRNAREIGL